MSQRNRRRRQNNGQRESQGGQRPPRSRGGGDRRRGGGGGMGGGGMGGGNAFRQQQIRDRMNAGGQQRPPGQRRGGGMGGGRGMHGPPMFGPIGTDHARGGPKKHKERPALKIPPERPDFLEHEDSEFVRTHGRYTIECKGNEVRIYDPEETLITRIWGDPHVDEGGDGEDDWHFGEDSTFVLPDGTKICLDTEPNENDEWYVVGVDVIAGQCRFHYDESGTASLTSDGKEWDEAHADCSSDASAGVFALQSNGEWAVQGDDGKFYDITEESWAAYQSDRDVDYYTSAVAKLA